MEKNPNFFKQLRQRNVFRVGTMYVVGAWLLLQFGEVMIELWNCLWMGRALVVILALGFPFVLLMAWVTPRPKPMPNLLTTTKVPIEK